MFGTTPHEAGSAGSQEAAADQVDRATDFVRRATRRRVTRRHTRPFAFCIRAPPIHDDNPTRSEDFVRARTARFESPRFRGDGPRGGPRTRGLCSSAMSEESLGENVPRPVAEARGDDGTRGLQIRVDECDQLEEMAQAESAARFSHLSVGRFHGSILRLEPSARRAVVLRAMQFVEDAVSRRGSVADLCREVGLGARSLEYAFREICQGTPQQYIHAQRWRRDRQPLRESDCERGAVKAAAYAAGFRELERFSVRYRQFFNESPSETLDRA